MKDEEFNKKLGAALRTERISKQFDGAEVARMLGLRGSTISQWENGKRTMDVQSLVAYLKAINVALDVFFERYFKEQ